MSVRRLFWEPPGDSDLAGHKIYIAPAGADLGSEIKNGTASLLSNIPLGQNEYHWDDDGYSPGDWQFMVTAYDDSGNESDPYQHPGWAVVNVAVPVDTTPPSPPTGGGIEIVS